MAKAKKKTAPKAKKATVRKVPKAPRAKPGPGTAQGRGK